MNAAIAMLCYSVSGLSPFCGDDDSETICNIQMVDFDFAAEEFDEVTAGCKDFIKKLLLKDPRQVAGTLQEHGKLLSYHYSFNCIFTAMLAILCFLLIMYTYFAGHQKLFFRLLKHNTGFMTANSYCSIIQYFDQT